MRSTYCGLLAAWLALLGNAELLAQHYVPSQKCCPPSSRRYSPQPPVYSEREEAPPTQQQPDTPEITPPEPVEPSFDEPIDLAPATGSFGLASAPVSAAPNMIGDTTGGGCGSLTFSGAVGAQVSHPTFACSRLNIAENNSPIVRRRDYLSYRHFHNASDISIFPNDPGGGQNSLHIERFTLGFERPVFEGTSVELRVPINHELNSNLNFSQTTGPVIDLPLDDATQELGNLALILKHRLRDGKTYYLSGGVSLNIPTAPDVTLRGFIDDDEFPVTEDAMGNPILLPVEVDFNGVVRNETWNLSPFLAGVWTPNEKWFTQGFLQVDIPLNRSQASLDFTGTIPGANIPDFNEADLIAQQTLMRVNVGVGRWWFRHPCAFVRGIATMLEVHHTTTLEDAELLGPVSLIPGQGGVPETVLRVGNLANRVDSTNVVLGVPIQTAWLDIYNGFIAPVTTGDNRGFDFEYNLMIQRRY